MMIDLRSDTFTKPGPAMLEAISAAKVGDDVFGEDPTVNALESLFANGFGREASLFLPTGTMANQIAVKLHTQPGNEVICDRSAHVYAMEGGGIAFNSGCQVKAIEGHLGKLSAADVKNAINPEDVHRPQSTLVCLENTANRGGGSCYDLETIEEIKEVCSQHGLKLHLDGARLMNAIVAKKQTPQQFGQLFHSITVCLNKGLGAPIGSMLIGDADFIAKARRIRKVLGGGMRQAGFMAAAGMFAIQNNVNRLSDDHAHAEAIAAELAEADYIKRILPVETNIVIFELNERYTAKSFCAKLKDSGILALPVSESGVRMVTHLDVIPQMIDQTIQTLKHF